MKRLRRCSKKSILILVLFFTHVGCTASFNGVEYRRGQSEQKNQNFSEAIKHYQKVIARAPDTSFALKSSREAARLALFETKDYLKAVDFYRHVVNYSDTDKERREAQKTIAKIYLEKLANYAQAAEEYNKLLLLRSANEDVVDNRFDLAKALFYMNKFDEAQSEIDQALKVVEDKDKKFELLMFLGNIYFNTRKSDQAISTYEEVMRLYPERAKKDNVAMNIVVCYEDAEAFDKAIERLEQMRPQYPDPDFIDLKIKRMKARKANLPGSKGLRK